MGQQTTYTKIEWRPATAAEAIHRLMVPGYDTTAHGLIR